eukprot:CAMPEP_0118913988 /NCGR_PEP_ID=MMETSP1166-20130328/14538_1 /TAXON_ID=1104430 /ORGANISM="Chrysoreinhardia sp, Strain CCMP3193" /LENGTH=311 /DNA_ID=CAMNT_0006853553 /DNA_START=18 /DNA_END=953 /DNA_ORIENTATION=+
MRTPVVLVLFLVVAAAQEKPQKRRRGPKGEGGLPQEKPSSSQQQQLPRRRRAGKKAPAPEQQQQEGGDSFEGRVVELGEFVKSHGHSDVPRETKLGEWLARARRAARTGRLPAAKKQQLEAAGGTLKPLENRWDEGYRLVSAFVKRQNTSIPKTHAEEGVNLFAWVHQQRRDARSGSLSDERREKLAALGLMPRSKEDARRQMWLRYLSALEAYVAREGHPSVPRAHVEKNEDQRPLKLGAWLAKQRSRFRDGTLFPDQQAALEKLGVPLSSEAIGPSKQPQQPRPPLLRAAASKKKQKKKGNWASSLGAA